MSAPPGDTLTSLPTCYALETTAARAFDLDRLERYLTLIDATSFGWGKKQNSADNALTRFIYDERRFDLIEQKVLANLAAKEPGATPARAEALIAYARKRWYSHWATQGQEALFHEAGATPNPDLYDRRSDFSIEVGGFPLYLDHKASVWPRNDSWKGTIEQVRQDPMLLLQWLIANAGEDRHNANNKVYVVCKAADGNHERLKASFSTIRPHVQAWMAAPDLRCVTVDGKSFLVGLVLVEE